eukprot:SM000318S12214  [mRNA]  locus=s318:95579:99081:+ [translate_table: standard]
MFLCQTPKDFDILSTAEVYQVKRLFRGRAIVVGRRFPICQVHMHGAVVEVTSFSTKSGALQRGGGKCRLPRAQPCSEGEHALAPAKSSTVQGKGAGLSATHPGGCEVLRAAARLENTRSRDFTVNGLLYDPFENILYDYVGGIRDLKKRKISTILPAAESLAEDSARMLRAVRIAARLGFSLDGSLRRAVEMNRQSVVTITKARRQSEMQMFLAYGAAEATIRLLWKLELLEYLLPLHKLLASLDRVSAPNDPCEGALWTSLLAFQLAVAELSKARVVVAAAALTPSERRGTRAAAVKALKIDRQARREEAEEDCREGSGRGGETGPAVQEDKVLGAAVSLDDIVRQSQELAAAACSALGAMSDVEVVAREVRKLTGNAASEEVVLQKNWVADARALLSAATGADRSKAKDMPAPRQTSAKQRELAFTFSRTVLNALYPPQKQTPNRRKPS